MPPNDRKAAHGLDLLTEKEKEALRLYLVESSLQRVADRIGISVKTVEQRHRRAREKLGVTRTLDAAHRLAAAEGQAIYERPLYDEIPRSFPASNPSDGPAISEPQSGDWRPFATWERPWNETSPRQRLTLILLLAVLLSILTGGLALGGISLFEAIATIVRDNAAFFRRE